MSDRHRHMAITLVCKQRYKPRALTIERRRAILHLVEQRKHGGVVGPREVNRVQVVLDGPRLQQSTHSRATLDERVAGLLELQHHASVPQWTNKRANIAAEADLCVYTYAVLVDTWWHRAIRHAIRQPALRHGIRLAVASVGISK